MPLPMPMGLPGAEPPAPPPPAPPPDKRDYRVPRAVRCSACRRVGLASFEEGWNLKQADRLMDGRPIPGKCGYCGRDNVELIPIPNLTPSDQRELGELYGVQETLEYARARGWPVGPRSLMMPVKWLEDRYRRWEGA